MVTPHGLEKDPKIKFLLGLMIAIPITIVFGLGFAIGWFACKYWGLG